MEPIDDRVEDVEHRFLRPMGIIEDHHERSVCGERFEQPANGPRRIGGERLVNTEDLRESIPNCKTVRFACQTPSKCRGDRPRVRAR